MMRLRLKIIRLLHRLKIFSIVKNFEKMFKTIGDVDMNNSDNFKYGSLFPKRDWGKMKIFLENNMTP